jgi:hypothetical protein
VPIRPCEPDCASALKYLWNRGSREAARQRQNAVNTGWFRITGCPRRGDRCGDTLLTWIFVQESSSDVQKTPPLNEINGFVSFQGLSQHPVTTSLPVLCVFTESPDNFDCARAERNSAVNGTVRSTSRQPTPTRVAPHPDRKFSEMWDAKSCFLKIACHPTVRRVQGRLCLGPSGLQRCP